MHLFAIQFFPSQIINSEFENLLHTIGFTVVSIIIYLTLKRIVKRQFVNTPLQLYIETFLITIFIGIVAEIVQSFFSRDSSVIDLLRDASGAITGLLLIGSRDELIQKPNGKTIVPLYIPALIIVLLMSVPFLKTSIAFYYKDKSGPVFFTFERWWEEKLIIKQKEIIYALVTPPDSWQSNNSKKAAKITFLGGEYPGICVEEIYQNWSDYKYFQMHLYSESVDTITLSIRIDDHEDCTDYQNRFGRSLQIIPGENKISIPTNDIRNQVQNRQLNLSEIKMIVMFAVNPQQQFTLYFDDIMLSN
jgi:hypothetical protein